MWLSITIPHNSSWNIVDLIIAVTLLFTLHKGWVRGLRGTGIVYTCIAAGIIVSEVILPKMLVSFHEQRTREIMCWALIIGCGICGYLLGTTLVSLLGSGVQEGLLGLINRGGGAIVHTIAFTLVAWLLCISFAKLTPIQVQRTIEHSVAIGFVNHNSPDWFKELPEKIHKEIFLSRIGKLINSNNSL